jgi:hypothetical protein
VLNDLLWSHAFLTIEKEFVHFIFGPDVANPCTSSHFNFLWSGKKSLEKISAENWAKKRPKNLCRKFLQDSLQKFSQEICGKKHMNWLEPDFAGISESLLKRYSIRKFRHHFGVNVEACATIWLKIPFTPRFSPSALLQTLNFLKVYPTDIRGATSWNVDTHTWRKNVKLGVYFVAIALPQVSKFGLLLPTI